MKKVRENARRAAVRGGRGDQVLLGHDRPDMGVRYLRVWAVRAPPMNRVVVSCVLYRWPTGPGGTDSEFLPRAFSAEGPGEMTPARVSASRSALPMPSGIPRGRSFRLVKPLDRPAGAAATSTVTSTG